MLSSLRRRFVIHRKGAMIAAMATVAVTGRVADRGALGLGVLALLITAPSLGCGPSKAIPGDVVRVRLLDDRAHLVGTSRSGCTHQEPPSANGHRWCAFTLGTPEEALTELWVIDVSAAAAGEVPPCDGSSDGCLHLTSTLAPRTGAFFDGDTLIYHSDAASAPPADFLGKIFAWRPGWSGGRQISSDHAFTCIGQRRSASAACFDDPGGDPAKRDTAQVRVGRLDGERGGPLPVIGRWPLRNDNDTAWDAAFSPDGSLFGLSSAATIGAKQALEIVATKDAGVVAPSTIIDDIAHWRISNDGKGIYFVRGLPQRADLLVADFPSGAGAKLVEPGILSFSLVGERPQDQALAFVKDLGETKGEFKLLSNSRQTPKTIFDFDDVLEGVRVSLDLRYTVWLDFAFRGVVIRNHDLAPCALDVEGEPPVFEPAFLDHAGLMFWREIRPGETSRRDAFFAPPDRCREKRLLAADVDFVTPIGDRGVVFAYKQEGIADRLALEYAAVSRDGASLDRAVRVDEVVPSSVVFVGGDPLLLVYSVVAPSAAETGLFVYGPLPF